MKEKLSKRAYNKILSIAQGTTKAYRRQLNKNIHVAEISFNAFKNSVNNLTEVEYGVIYAALQNAANKSSTSLKNAISQVKSNNWTGLVFVDDKTYGPFLIASSYNSLQQKISTIFKELSTTYSNLESLVGKDTSGRTFARVGHIASNFSHGTTPLLEKFRDIVKRLPLAAANTVTVEMISQLQRDHTFDVEYVFNREAVGLSSILGRGVVFVTIQSDAKNSALATLETEINRKVIEYLQSESFILDNLNEPGSNTIIQDIELLIAHTLDSKKYKKPKKPTTKPPVKGKSKAPAKSAVLPFKVPSLPKSKDSEATNLSLLQIIINSKITEQIKNNMGNGTRKDVLNNRTGRFAESVHVERLVESRAGMITAFYSYMKNPYATFSAGGRQEKPRSRDPKLLIAKSIREIAQEHVANKLRAVVV